MTMHKKLISAPVALVATLAFAAGPVIADDATPDDVPTPCVDDSTIDVPTDENVDEPAYTDLDEITEAAEDASAAVTDIADEESNDDDDACVTGHDRARESLEAALARIGEGGGNGVASQILTALMNGESPAGIGHAHGKDMAQAAVDRRAERDDAETGRPDHAGRPVSGADDDVDAEDTGTEIDDDVDAEDTDTEIDVEDTGTEIDEDTGTEVDDESGVDDES